MLSEHDVPELFMNCAFQQSYIALLVVQRAFEALLFVFPSSLHQTFDAHNPGECWSVCVSPDSRALASGGGDKTLKFWDFDLVSPQQLQQQQHQGVDEAPPPVSGGKQLTLKHNRTLQLDEAVLGVKVCERGNSLALRSTAKVIPCANFSAPKSSNPQ